MNAYAQKELAPPDPPVRRGEKGWKVQQVQEWLCLHGFRTAVDGDFGPATEAALRAWQQHEEADHDGPGAWTYGEVNQAVWHGLVAPLRRAEMWKPHKAVSVGHNVVECAHAHLAAQPREVGGPNAGPWVRYYCRGLEVPWCAGFVGTVLWQALGHDDWYTLSCDELAHKAQARDLWVPATATEQKYLLKPGCLFLVRASEYDWIHTGIVTAVSDWYFETIEGNTNTNGAREGTAAHARTRAFGPHVDFVLVGDR